MTGRFEKEVIFLIVGGGFPALIGFLVASKLVGYINEGLYRKIVVAVIIAAGVLMLVRAGLKTSWI